MSKKILIIDDNLIELGFFRNIIEQKRSWFFRWIKKNIDVDTARNKDEALIKIDEFHPNLILLDIHLPEKEGLAPNKNTGHSLIDYFHDKKLKYITITSDNCPDIVAASRTYDSHAYMDKPNGDIKYAKKFKKQLKKLINNSGTIKEGTYDNNSLFAGAV